jgi:FHA domain
MARLIHKHSGRTITLQSDHLVGRSERCALRLDDDFVSSEHATLRWDGSVWSIRDRGSLNHTFVDRVALQPGACPVLRLGMDISFGCADDPWTVADISAPAVMAVSLDGADVIDSVDGLLGLPSAERPLTTVMRDRHGAWAAEWDGGSSPVRDRQRIEVGGREYLLILPQVQPSTAPRPGLAGTRVSDTSLTFSTSQDLENIVVDTEVRGFTHHFPARAHHELLFILARARIEDVIEGMPASSAGWRYQDLVCRQVGVDVERLNVDVYRLRRQFAEIGLLDPAQIVERRPRSRQLRIGTDKLSFNTD